MNAADFSIYNLWVAFSPRFQASMRTVRLAFSYRDRAIHGESPRSRRICDSQRIAVALLALLLTFFASGSVYADDNLLLNGDLNQGAGNLPYHWSAEAAAPRGTGATFSWVRQPGDGSELRLDSIKPGGAEWVQTVGLTPGWYRVSGEIETTDVASLNVARIGIKFGAHRYSGRLRGPDRGSGWSPNEFYFRIDKPEQTVEVICRLAGKGSARYRHLRLIRVSGSPPPGAARLALDAAAAKDAARGAWDIKPYSARSSVGWLLAAVVGLLIAGRLMFDRFPHLARDERVLVVLAALTFALVFSWPLLGRMTERGTFDDWDTMMAMKWTSRKSILTYHQLPLWDPYRCGGMPMLGNPQSQIISPFFPLSLMFGVFPGTHLQILLCLALAWTGGYVLGRTLGISRFGAIATAMVFPASSWFYLKLGEGHIYALDATYLPWAFAATVTAVQCAAWRYTAAAGAVLALTFLGSGPDSLVYGAVSLGALMAATAWIDRSWRPLGVLAAVGLFVAGFVAIKALPSYLLIQAHPRPTGDQLEVNYLRTLLDALFSRDQQLQRETSNYPYYGFWETGAYIGMFVVPAVLGFAQKRRAAPWILSGVVLLLLARGDAQPWPLWPLLHRLPVLSSMRLPTRFLVPFTLVIGVLAGLGIDWLTARWRPWGAVAGAVLIAAATIDCLLVGPPNLVEALIGVAPDPLHAMEFRQVLHGLGADTDILFAATANRGVLNCYEYAAWTTNARGSDQPGYQGEQYLLGPGSVRIVDWTPNVLTYNVTVPAAGEFVVNQNYDRWWRVIRGRGVVVNEHGLIGIRVPAGSQRIVIAYRDYGALLGAVITLTTIAAAGALWRRETHGARCHS